MSGIVLADPELRALLFQAAIDRVDEHLRAHPDLVAKLGVSGMLLSVWSLYATYAAAVDQFADRFEQARRDGWEVDRLASMITTPMKQVDLSVAGLN